MQDKEKILSDIQSLIQDIDKCIGEFNDGRLVKWDDLDVTHVRLLDLLSAAHQELSFLYEYIKEGGEDA